MKRRFAFMAIPMAVVLAAAIPGHAQTQTATYVTANNSVLALRVSQAGTGVGIGGYGFSATSTAPISVKVVDVTGNNVGWTACQDPNANALCGEAGEPRATGCSTGASQALTGFKPNTATTVFVYTISLECEGTGLTGTISLTN